MPDRRRGHGRRAGERQKKSQARFVRPGDRLGLARVAPRVRKLADRRVYPAIDISQSGTRKEERLLPPEVLQRVTLLRRTLIQMPPVQAMESLVKKLGELPSNAAFLDKIALAVR